MPDIMDPSVNAFYIQNLAKEKTLRLKWYQKNINKIKKNRDASSSDQKYNETDDMLDKLIAEIESKDDGKHIVKESKAPVMEVFDIYETMRPVEPEVTKLIYKSVMKDGREKYLRERTKKAPADKYYFQECSSWVYGWHLKKSIQAPMQRYARVEIIKHSFYRKSGIGEDPIHYKEPAR